MASKRLAAWPAQAELAAQGRSWLEQWQAAWLGAGNDAPFLSEAGLDKLARAFCCSPFVAKTLVANPSLATQLLTADGGTAEYGPECRDTDLQMLASTDEAAFMQGLRRIRQREMVRIALRDLLGDAGLDETLAALTALADFCLQQAHAKAYEILSGRHGVPENDDGEPQSLIVLAMGKLGGGELNYSSDIDLMFTYPDDGQTRAGDGQRRLDNQVFFTQQAQLLIRFLNEATPDGFVFRVDARLRPFGDSGALVTSFDFMESYYQNQGRDWERYALIKARPVCGDAAQRDYLMSMLRPFVYRRYLDYGAFQSLREMKALIEREVSRKGLRNNIKLGPGGIREIEFTGQAFQLIRGGREPELRNRSIMKVLKILGERYLLTVEAVERLLAAYRFLRDTENRLQMVDDQQTHNLPRDALEQARLAYAMGFADWNSFHDALERHRETVSEQFGDIFFSGEQASRPDEYALQLSALIEGRLRRVDEEALLRRLRFADIEPVLAEIGKFRESHAVRHIGKTGAERLAQLLPLLFEAIAATDAQADTLHRVLALLEAVVQRAVYLALLIEYPEVLQQVVKLCAASGWIADYLRQQPILLDSLLDSRLLYQLPDRRQLASQLRELVKNLADEDQEQRLNALRHFKQEQTLRVAAVDVTSRLPLMKVSDQLTWLAEAIVDEMHAMAVNETTAKYGRPVCRTGGREYHPELAVVAYGKLGGIELGYGSDLDLVFLHNSEGGDQLTDGERQIANETYFARLAQRLIHLLSVQTVGGVLYEVDVRLRPDGAAGMLVSSMERFAEYQRNRAWTWEHQALVRARVVVGGPVITEAFRALRHEILTRPRDIKALCGEIRAMRDRMRAELAKSRQGEFDLKQDRGGIADIEFMVQYGVLAWARDYPALTEWTDNIRILEQFGRFGLIPAGDAALLTDAYKHLRENAHRLALQGESAVLRNIDLSRNYIEAVAGIWERTMRE
ncbi:MAG TPA: bifunctional [glutamate--ammonia ligase]-adenylyl-L-tyrosine phosphorylase/[glutamate--ammonia-ligase] adenylyltransferase [Gammaproteobacteria bacterium]